MAVIEEPRLKAELKSGKLERLYFLFGEEIFLTRMYEKKITEAAVGKEPSELNFVKFSGNPPADGLSDFAESLPFFSEYKCIVISDLDADKLDNAELAAYLSIIENLPESTVLIISETGIEIDAKKPKAKLKKLLAAAEKHGCVCELRYMTAAQVSSLAEKKAAKSGCSLSRENGLYLAELCGRSLASVSNEMQKLCDYTGSGEITKEAIDALVPRMIDTGIYTLSTELFAGRREKAFRILDDLFAQQIAPVIILSALSGAFVDFYRAKLGQQAKKSAADTAKEFGYFGGRAYGMTKAYSSVKNLSERYLRDCIDVLYRTNRLLNSSKADRRVLIEQALTEIAVMPR